MVWLCETAVELIGELGAGDVGVTGRKWRIKRDTEDLWWVEVVKHGAIT